MRSLSRITSLGAVVLTMAACTVPAGDQTIYSGAPTSFLTTAETPVEICARLMPDTQAVMTEFQSRGYQQVEREGGKRFFLIDGWNVAAEVQSSQSPDRVCAVRVANMSVEQGFDLIQPWVVATNGEAQSQMSRQVTARWTGTRENNLAFLAVIRSIVSTDIQGAAISYNAVIRN